MSGSITSEINIFLDHLRFEKRYSQHTLRSYSDDLRQFSDYLQTAFSGLALPEISAGVVRSWLASLKDEKLAARSINRKISTLKSFFKYLMKVGVVKKSPLTGVSSPRAGKKLPGFVEEEDISTLFQHVEFPDDWSGRTARLALQMLYQLGLRLSELVNCRESEIDFFNRQIKVLGKGNKERIIPVGNELLSDIEKYMADKAPGGSGYLLINDRGRKLYPKYIYRVTRQYLPLVTTIAKKSPHVLRHSFATHLMNNGAELNAVKELLGHSSLAATQVYTHNTIEKLKNVHKKAHPKG